MKQQHYLEHSKINTYILPILAGVTVAITYAVASPYWLRSIEYDSLYLGTTEFITGKLSEPQGLTLLVSAYLRQFYQWPILAALVIGILIILTGGSITIISKKQGNTYHWLSLIPPVILTTIGKGDPYFLVTGMFFWTTMALYVLISRIRIPLAFFILLVGYELLPWFIWAVWFLLAVFIEWTTRTGKKALIPIICLFIACFIPHLWSQYILFIPETDRFLNEIGKPIIHACFILPIPIFYFLKRIHNLHPTAINICGSLIFLIGSVYFIIKSPHLQYTERIKKISYQADHNDWNGILADISYEDCVNPILLRYALLAESMQGTLPEHLFSYPVKKADNFIFNRPVEKITLNFNRQFYNTLNIYDEAFRLSFEYGTICTENYSVGNLRKMASYAIASGDTSVANTYINILAHTPFNDNWINTQKQTLANLSHSHSISIPNQSQVFIGAMPFLSEIARLFDESPQNKRLLDYTLCSLLIERNLNKFFLVLKKTGAYQNQPLPRAYAEAIAMLIAQDESIQKNYHCSPSLQKLFHEVLCYMENPSTSQVPQIPFGSYWTYFFSKEIP